MKRRVTILLFSLLSSVLFIVVLYILSQQLNHRPNGFIRLFPPHMVIPLKIADLTYNSYYIAGATSTNIYFGNYTTLNYLLASRYNLVDTTSIRLKFQADARLVKGSAKIIIDSPNIYISDGRIPALFHATFSDLTPSILRHDTSLYFISATPTSATSCIFQVFDRQLHESKMAKENFASSEILYAPTVLERQQDGLFSTDGMLNTAPHSAFLVYVYHYRNQFICLDTNLNVVYKERTIDTISKAQINLTRVSSEKSITFANPPLTVNQHSCISDKWILVHSLLKANNEVQKEFEKYSVIDVYSLKTGSYTFSFYLPDYDTKKVTDIKLFNKTLVALYGKYAYTFLVNF